LIKEKHGYDLENMLIKIERARILRSLPKRWKPSINLWQRFDFLNNKLQAREAVNAGRKTQEKKSGHA